MNDRRSTVLNTMQKSFWESNGFLVIEGLFADADLNPIDRLIERLWEERPPTVVVDDLFSGRRTTMPKLTPGETSHNFKINDLYLDYEEVRRLSLHERVVPVLGDLLTDVPVLVNSLSFERGSQQPFHVDSLYMTPASVGNLVATWIALEDCHPDAGPLRYYPESQRITPYQFSTGSYHFVPDEMPGWNDYVFEQVEDRRLEEQWFPAKKGDLFIWSSNLLHGGSPICDPQLTRHSLVSHFWTHGDVKDEDLVPFGDAYWLRRPPQAVTDQDTATDVTTEPPSVRDLDLSIPAPTTKARLRSLVNRFNRRG